jgi:hypothetical protein
MFDSATDDLQGIPDRYPWVSELAGILPLSALIDFLDIPTKLHLFQLVGGVPLWSWPVTPGGSRLLLSDDEALQRTCYLDRHGNSTALLAMDGYYGETYFIANPETVRLCVSSQPATPIQNTHANMDAPDRIQTIDIIHVTRSPNAHAISDRWLGSAFRDFWWMHSLYYLAVSISGWALLAGMVVMCIILQTWIALAFLLVVPVTGSVISALYGATPRDLLEKDPKDPNKPQRYSRLILVGEHGNVANWTVFYGDSIYLNSLLNRPLEPKGPQAPAAVRRLLRLALSVFILGQWAIAIAATATKTWNSYFICFWVTFCIFTQAYVISAEASVQDWMASCAGIKVHRYTTRVSSRRALLNTVLALNPNTFPLLDAVQQTDDRTRLYEDGLKWLDNVLKAGPSRTEWQEASREAMVEAANLAPGVAFPSAQWLQNYPRVQKYWSPYIPEGVELAAKIKREASLPGRIVP